MKMLAHSSGRLFEPLIHSGLRLGFTLTIALMVISSPIFTITSPKIVDGAVTTPKIADGAIQPQVVSRSSNNVIVPPLASREATAFCLSGETPVSGGVFINQGPGFLTITEQHHRTDDEGNNGWVTEMFNSHSTNSHSFEAIVTCMPAMP